MLPTHSFPRCSISTIAGFAGISPDCARPLKRCSNYRSGIPICPRKKFCNWSSTPPNNAPNGERRAAATRGKKKAHTVKTQIVVDKKGNIVHISKSVPGNIHDKKLFDKSKVKLPGNAKGDLGYLGTNIRIPIKASKLHSLTQKQIERNKRFSKRRIVVEHVFASLKAYRILADRFRGSLANYHQYFLIVCGLRNLARA